MQLVIPSKCRLQRTPTKLLIHIQSQKKSSKVHLFALHAIRNINPAALSQQNYTDAINSIMIEDTDPRVSCGGIICAA